MQKLNISNDKRYAPAFVQGNPILPCKGDGHGEDFCNGGGGG